MKGKYARNDSSFKVKKRDMKMGSARGAAQGRVDRLRKLYDGRQIENEPRGDQRNSEGMKLESTRRTSGKWLKIGRHWMTDGKANILQWIENKRYRRIRTIDLLQMESGEDQLNVFWSHRTPSRPF